MIEQDQALLGRLSTVNRELRAVVLDILAKQDGGVLPAAELWRLGHGLVTLGQDMMAYAAELQHEECKFLLSGQP